MYIILEEIVKYVLKEHNFKVNAENIKTVLDSIDSTYTMLCEGTWKVPYTYEETLKLAKLMENPILKVEAGDGAIGSELNKLIGDDSLYDDIAAYDNDEDIRPAIRKLLSRWVIDQYYEFGKAFKEPVEERVIDIWRRIANGYWTNDGKEVQKHIKNPTKVDLEINYYRLIHKMMHQNRNLLIRLTKELELDDNRGDKWAIWFDDNCVYFTFYYNNCPNNGPAKELSKEIIAKYGIFEPNVSTQYYKIYGQGGKLENVIRFEKAVYSLPLDNIDGFNRRVMDEDGGRCWTHSSLLESYYTIRENYMLFEEINRLYNVKFINLLESKCSSPSKKKLLSESQKCRNICIAIENIVLRESSLEKAPIIEGISVGDVSIEDLLKDINNSMKSLQSQKAEFDKAKAPSNIKMMFGGANDNQILKILYSTGLDKSLDGIFTAFMHGDYDKVNLDSDAIFDILNKFGLGNNTQVFQGEISNLFIGNIRQSITSDKFNKMNSNIRKCMYILHNLKKEAKSIDDPEKKAKFKNAIYSFKKILKLVRSIYKNRDIINQRSLAGINAIMFENFSDEIVYLVGI